MGPLVSWADDGIDQAKAAGDWLVATVEGHVRELERAGEHERALATVDAALREVRDGAYLERTKRTLGALRKEIAQFLERQRVESVA